MNYEAFFDRVRRCTNELEDRVNQWAVLVFDLELAASGKGWPHPPQGNWSGALTWMPDQHDAGLSGPWIERYRPEDEAEGHLERRLVDQCDQAIGAYRAFWRQYPVTIGFYTTNSPCQDCIDRLSDLKSMWHPQISAWYLTWDVAYVDPEKARGTATSWYRTRGDAIAAVNEGLVQEGWNIPAHNLGPE